jgi:nitrogen fixation protein
MSDTIDISVGLTEERVEINATPNVIEVNIITGSTINPLSYDLADFTNNSANPFVQYNALNTYTPTSRLITINGITQDLSADRSWTLPIPSITGLVPYIGATANVNLGEYELKTGQLTLDTTPTGTAAVGTTRWNDSIGSPETTLKGGSVIIKNGVDLVARVVNEVTPNTTLTKANYPVVRVSGAQGQRLAVAYAQANNDNNSADTLGLVIETIATNQEGFIMTVGQIEEVNTTGSLQGETWVDGDVLYLSPTTPGAVTNIKPTGLTGHIVVIGYVEYSHAIHGKIYVKIMNGWELDELHNVYINPATLANNNILQYDSTDSLWKNKVLATGITIGTTAITSGVVGRVLFEGTGNVVSESANLFWDNTNLILTLGSTATRILNFRPQDTTGAYGNSCSIRGGASFGRLDFYSASNITELKDNIVLLTSVGGPSIQVGASSISLNVASAIRLQVAPTTGNILINTTTDAGYKFDVNGTARVKGTGATSATTAFTVQNSGGTTLMSVRDDSRIIMPVGGGGNVSIGSLNANTNAIDLRGYFQNGTNCGIYIENFNAGTIKTQLGSQTNGVYVDLTQTFSNGGRGGIGMIVTGIVNNTGTSVGDIAGYSFAPTITSLTGGSVLYAFNSTVGGAYINTSSRQASSILQADSTTQGFLPPRMTTTQKNAIATPATGLQIYDLTLNRPCFYDGTSWITL